MRRISSALAVAACLAALLAGCAGPKRLPPVSSEPEAPRRADDPAAPRLLAVGLAEAATELVLAATGPAVVVDAGTGLARARLAVTGSTVTCRRSGDGVFWSLAGAEGVADRLRVMVLDPAHRVTHGEAHYRGAFLVIPTPGRSTGLTLVNDVELEAYLRGVVPWEIGRHERDALAALEAQAIAARTYTVSHLGARSSRGFDVFASVMDQVYKGARDEDPLCNEAIDHTAGLVLRHGGEEIEAYYSACCGGASSNVEEVWPKAAEPWLTSRRDGPRDGDPWCAGSRYYHWRESWTRPELEAKLAATLPAYLDHMAQNGRTAWAGRTFTPADAGGNPDRPGHLRDLEVVRRTSSGRVAELQVTTDAGIYHVRGDRVRWVLPPPSGRPAILRSALFDLELERVNDTLRRVSVRGRGYGHGIGMCQTGALEMARHGRTAEQILGHYYPGAVLVRVAGVSP